jgi:RNA polymerase sigma-70 factor (ECF subfamily)
LKATEHEADERRLIEAARRDSGRFAEIYQANFPRVYAFVARRVKSREEAEDVTAEVFQQALAGLGGFEWRGAPFIAWLLGIASHLVARYWKGTQPEVPIDELELEANSGQAEYSQSAVERDRQRRRHWERRRWRHRVGKRSGHR